MAVGLHCCGVLLCLLLFAFVSQSAARSYSRSNICAVINKKPRCCLGWALDETNLQCTQPVCTGECEVAGGRCVRPDTCLCPGGYVAYDCVVNNRDSGSVCGINCKNGGTCSRDKCYCKPGFSGDRCQVAECPRNCSRQGVCQSNGECRCNNGFSGRECSEEPQEACFRDVSRGLCRSEILGLKTTMQVCCNSVGKAWGTPCRRCTRMECDKGFQMQQRRCVDINECKLLPGICRGGVCQNTDGDYVCSCPTGTVYNRKTFTCDSEYDVCKRNPRVCGQGRCLSNGIGFRCKCYAGYKLSADGKRCESKPSFLRFDMCYYNKGYLCANGKCIPQGRSYRCRCNPGYQVTTSGRACEKQVDSCSFYGSRVCANGMCQSVGNDYRCQCNAGYEPSADQKKCISTCERYGQSICPNGRCVPSALQGYECKCDKGFYQSLSRKKCVRETSVIRTVCDYYTLCTNGRCVPMGNTYRCNCNNGFERTPNGKACREAPRKTPTHMCDLYADYYCPNAKCIRIGSNYRCECNPGFEMGNSGRCRAKSKLRRTSRKEVTKRGEVRQRRKNYCNTYTYLCENGRCIPTQDYFYCQCNAGYQQADSRRRCVKEEKKPAKLRSGFYDFCQHYRHLCRGGTCHNEPTNYWCTCTPGYTWDERLMRCVQEKPRRLVSDQWNNYARRRHKPTDWRRNNRWHFSACERMGRDVCGKGYCVDKSSSFECRCYEGFQPTQHKKRCVDINECDINPNICWYGKCVNLPGDYSCQCGKGYELSHVNKQPMCVDRNECKEGNPCRNGDCKNTWGSYRCICYEGFTSDISGQNCVPKNTHYTATRKSGKLENESKVAEVWSDEAIVDNGNYVKNCSFCKYDCRWLSNGQYLCECPQGLSPLGKSDLCVEENAVHQYTFEIQMDEPDEDRRRRRKRSVPGKEADKHLRARIVLKDGVDVDHFVNTLTSRYQDVSYDRIVHLGRNGTHSFIDVFF